MLLGEEVPALNRATAHVIGQAAPDSERPAFLLIPAIQPARLTPQHQQGNADPPSGAGVRPIVLRIDGRGRAILLADRVDVIRIEQRVAIGRPQIGIKHVGRRPPIGQGIVDHCFRACADQSLG
jgi:hypothetical protein